MAPTYPFDPGKRGSLAPIRRDDEPGAVGEEKEEYEGEGHDSRSSNNNSSSRKRLDGIWDGASTYPFDQGKRGSLAPIRREDWPGAFGGGYIDGREDKGHEG